MASLDRRIARLEERNKAGNELDPLEILREARLRAIRGEEMPERPITQEMLDDPVSGAMWRELLDARERVRGCSLQSSPDPESGAGFENEVKRAGV